MAATAAQVIAKISADLTQFKAGMNEAGEASKKAGESSGGFFKNAFSTMLGNVGAMVSMQLINLAQQGISAVFDEANLLTNAESQMNAVLKSTGDASGMTAQSLMNLADSMSKASGASESTILTGQNMLLTFTNIGASVFPQASQALLDMGVAFNHGTTNGLDLKDMAIQLGKALNDPLTGMTALRREGVTFSKAEEDQIKTMMAHNDIAGAQAVMLKELQNEFGGSAVAAGNTFGGALDKLKNIVVDFGANALMKVEDWAKPMITAFADWLPTALDSAGKALAPLGQAFQVLGKIWTTQVQPELQTLARMISVDVQPGLAAIGRLVQTLAAPFQQWGTAIGNALAPLGKMVAQGSTAFGFFQPLNQFIYQATQGFNLLASILSGQVSQSFNSTLKDWGPIIQQVSGWFQSQMIPALQTLEPPLEALVGVLVSKGIPAFFAVRDAVSHVVAVIVSTLLPIFEKIEPIVVRLAGYILDLGQKALAFLLPKVEDAVKAVSKFADELSTRLAPFISRLADGIQIAAGIIQAVWTALWPEILAVLKWTWDIISGIVKTAWDLLTGLFKIGADLLSGNWGQLWTDIKDTLGGVWNDLTTMVGNLLGDIGNIISSSPIFQFFNNFIIQPVKNAVQAAIGWIEGLWQDFINWISGNTGGKAPPNPTSSGNYKGGKGFASGGLVTSNAPITMNERGGEMVKLPTGSYVYPAGQFPPELITTLKQAVGARGGPTQNITFNGIADSTTIVNSLKLHQAQQKVLYNR